MMKRNITFIFFPLPFLFFLGCSENGGKSDAYGNFEATEITVSAQAAGEIMQFNLDEGNTLAAGKVIGWIDTTDLNLKKQQLKAQQQAVRSRIPNLKAQIEVYRQQQHNAARDLERIKAMYKEGAATEKQVDDLAGQIEVIDKQIEAVRSQEIAVHSEIEALRKQIAQVEENIRKSVIVNPAKGTVLTKYVNAHEIAAPGKPLYKIADLDKLKLKVYVSGDQLPDVKIGQEVTVLVDKNKTENRQISGRVSWISESAEFTPKIIQTKEERVNLVYAMKVLVENDGSLKIGMPGEVRF